MWANRCRGGRRRKAAATQSPPPVRCRAWGKAARRRRGDSLRSNSHSFAASSAFGSQHLAEPDEGPCDFDVHLDGSGTGFKPEHLGQLSFYLTAVDTQVKAPEDAPRIGLLLCKSKNKVVAEYALRDGTKPMGIAEYQLVHALPAQLETSLPSIERIEAELAEPKASTEAKPAAWNESDLATAKASRPKGGKK
jgi:hypothetical protein